MSSEFLLLRLEAVDFALHSAVKIGQERIDLTPNLDINASASASAYLGNVRAVFSSPGLFYASLQEQLGIVVTFGTRIIFWLDFLLANGLAVVTEVRVGACVGGRHPPRAGGGALSRVDLNLILIRRGRRGRED